MPLICRLAPPSPNMNIRPPITIATRASDRASGPVKAASRFEAARSHGDCASATAAAILIVFPAVALAQSPWERAASNLEATFTGPLARSLALVAIVIGGLMFMFGEGGAKRQISGIVFGGGLALFAAQFLAWLF